MIYLKLIGLIVLALALFIFLPFGAIWSVNTLFPVFTIPYTFDTWAAAMILGIFFRGVTQSGK